MSGQRWIVWMMTGLGEMKKGDIVVISPTGDFGKPRPGVVVQAGEIDEINSVVVCLMTSVLKRSVFRVTIKPSAETGLEKVSQVMWRQRRKTRWLRRVRRGRDKSRPYMVAPSPASAPVWSWHRRVLLARDGMPWRDSSSPDVRRIFAVQRPLQGIVLDVFTHALQRCLVADDVFVIIALPRKSVKAVLPDLSRCHRLERPHHLPADGSSCNRSGANDYAPPCGGSGARIGDDGDVFRLPARFPVHRRGIAPGAPSSAVCHKCLAAAMGYINLRPVAASANPNRRG